MKKVNAYEEYKVYDHHPVRTFTDAEKTIFKRIIFTQSVSGDTKQMRLVVASLLHELKRKGKVNDIVVDEMGNMLVTKGVVADGSAYPGIACHLDTVHAIVEKESWKIKTYTHPDGRRHWFSDTGIGGDDKCGIFLAMMLLDDDDIPALKAMFFIDEEVGCVGAKAVVKSHRQWFDNVGYIIEPDRRGSSDLIFKASGDAMASETFIKAVTEVAKPLGYTSDKGTYTDVMKIQEEINISVMNVSCGYYDAHTKWEFIDEADLLATRLLLKSIYTTLGGTSFPHVIPVPTWKNNVPAYRSPVSNCPSMWDDWFDNDDDDDNALQGIYDSPLHGRIVAELAIGQSYYGSPTYTWYLSNDKGPLSMTFISPKEEMAMKQKLYKQWNLIGKNVSRKSIDTSTTKVIS